MTESAPGSSPSPDGTRPTMTAPEAAPNPEDEYYDPLSERLRREPRSSAGVSVLAFDGGDPGRGQWVASSLADLVRRRGRAVETRVVPSHGDGGQGVALAEALAATTLPLVLITRATEAWSAAHLEPLLAGINDVDHVVGRRPAGGAWPGLLRRLGGLRWRLLFAVPAGDLGSPCRLHRREALAAIPLQSESELVDLEILAKATFLEQSLREVPVPALAGDPERRQILARHDLADLFRHPVFGFAAPIRPGAWDTPGPECSPVPRPGPVAGVEPAAPPAVEAPATPA